MEWLLLLMDTNGNERSCHTKCGSFYFMFVFKREPGKAYIDENLWIPKSVVNIENIRGILAFTNESGQTRLLFREAPHHLIVPRFFMDLNTLDVPVVDLRPKAYEQIKYQSSITLDALEPHETKQQDALKAITEKDGIIQMRCGGGKTVIAIEFIARAQAPALIVVNTNQLMEQWSEEIRKLLPVLPGGVGVLGKEVSKKTKESKNYVPPSILITTYQKLAISGISEDERRRFGVVIFDEAHHISAETFSYAANLFPCKRIGLSATPNRSDGMEIVHQLHIGPVIYKNLKQPLQTRNIFIKTGYSFTDEDVDVVDEISDRRGEIHLHKLSAHLGRHKQRLQFIKQLTERLVTERRKVLIISQSVVGLVNIYCVLNNIPTLMSDAVPQPKYTQKLKTSEIKNLRARLAELTDLLQKKPNHVKKELFLKEKARIESRLLPEEVRLQEEKAYKKDQKTFIRNVLKEEHPVGLLTAAVSKNLFHKMLKTKQVVLAIAQYGIEGLDEKTLDTIILVDPVTRKENLQQLVGRIQRLTGRDKAPEWYCLHDDNKTSHYMCRVIQAQLAHWPADEGGPLHWEEQ